MSFNLTQPLLRNRSVDQYRQQLDISRKQRDASDVSLNATVITTVRNVKNAYWDLAYARENLRAQQQALDLAKRALADNEKRVQIGTMAPIDIVEAQSEVARNDEAVIVAESDIRQAEDRLRSLVFDPNTPDFWTTVLEPTDVMPFQPYSVDVEGRPPRAREPHRVKLAQNSIEQSRSQPESTKGQTLPKSTRTSIPSNAAGGTPSRRSPFLAGDVGAPAARLRHGAG